MLKTIHRTGTKFSSPTTLRNLQIPASDILQARPIAEQQTVADCLQAAVTDEVASRLSMNGFVVVDNVFGASLAAKLCNEIESVHAAGMMHPNNTHFEQGGKRVLLEKSHILEGEAHNQGMMSMTPLFQDLANDMSFRTMLSLFLPHLRLSSQSIKLQYNPGYGACFPIHFDSDEAVDTRRVSAIVYMNPAWQPAHGGQLRLYPFPKAPIDIPPVNDRLVLLSSCRMLHRVLPTQHKRCCFTIWLAESRGGQKPPRSMAAILQSNKGKTQDKILLLREPELQKCVAKAMHAEEWIRSLLESHADTERRRAMILGIRQQVGYYIDQLQEIFPGQNLDSIAHQIGCHKSQWL